MRAARPTSSTSTPTPIFPSTPGSWRLRGGPGSHPPRQLRPSPIRHCVQLPTVESPMNIAAPPAPSTLIVDLRRTYAARYGAPLISQVAVDIFQLRYFTKCMSCTFCGDWCCNHGVDIDLDNVKRLMDHKDALETWLKIPASEWFTDELDKHSDYPGGACMRTNTRNGKCVFVNQNGRG